MTLMLGFYFVLCVYVVSLVGMLVSMPYNVAVFEQWCKRRVSNREKLIFFVFAFCPLVNTAELIFLIYDSASKNIRRMLVWVFFGNQDACDRWMNVR